MSNDILIIICSKNPKPYLLTNIHNYQNFYTNSKIIVVDSDSTDFTIYDKIKKIYPAVELHFIKNKNWEFGAYKYGYEKYPNFTTYICIQDSLLPKQKVNIDSNELYFFVYKQNSQLHNSGWNYYKKSIDRRIFLSKRLMENTIYSDFWMKSIKRNFGICCHISFIIKNEILKQMIDTLPVLPINKAEEMAYERIFGLFAEYHKYKPIYIRKEFLKRQEGRA